MSDIENSDSGSTDPDPTPPAPKPKLSNIEIHNLKKKVKAEVDAEKDIEIKEKDEKVDEFLKEAIEARKLHAPQYVLNLIETLDPRSQLEVLKAHSERNADPNTSSIGTPIGRNKDGLEEYMTYNPSNDKLDYSIPASVLMNPKNPKHKKLFGID